ncbi:MAG: hypothetical protein GC166_01830 [Alphaproteobacteria bacterium]|nr:hypothetical protein [Alphaproteobacteria bacterium]
MRKNQELDRETYKEVRVRQRAIGRELKRMYDGVANEPVPQDFLDLLKQIDKEKAEGGVNQS